MDCTVLFDRRETGHPYQIVLHGLNEAEFHRLAPENRISEFVDGVMIVNSPATPAHQETVQFITCLLEGFVQERRIGRVLTGPASVRLRPGLAREPDVFFLCESHLDRPRGGGVEGAVDLAIEVVSDGTRKTDREAKRTEYEIHGVEEYWIVDPRGPEVVRLRRGEAGVFEEQVIQDGTLDTPLLPDFRIDVAWLFESPPPSFWPILNELLRGLTNAQAPLKMALTPGRSCPNRGRGHR